MNLLLKAGPDVSSDWVVQGLKPSRDGTAQPSARGPLLVKTRSRSRCHTSIKLI